MGTWGYKPFDNDEALDYYGGLHRLAEMKQLINDGLAGKHRYCCAPYEIAGIVLESLGLYSLGHKDRLEIVLNSIKTRNFSSDVKDTLHESLETLISVSALSIDSRKKILQACIKCIKKYRDFDPYEYEQEVKNVVNIAQKALDSDLKNAVVISEQDLNWLIDSYENAEKQDAIDYIHRLYPNGLLIFNVDDTLIGIYPNEPKIDNRVEDSIDYCKSLGITMEEVNLKACNNINEYIKKHFSKGFKMKNDLDEDGCKITSFYSNDYNTVVTYRMDSKDFYDKLYRNNTRDSIIIKLLKNFVNNSANTSNKALTGNRAIDKFYDKHGKIIGYRITDGKNVRDVYSDQLKQAIASGRIKFDNLTLTKDGRLYMTSTD